MALALAQYEDLFQLVSGYPKGRQRGLPFSVQCGLCLYVYRLRVIVPLEEGLYIYAPGKPCGPNMLDELLKGFTMIPVDLPWQWVKRLITSGERLNHDSWVKIYNLCRVLKSRILAELTVRSGLGDIYIKGDDSCCVNMLIFIV